MGTSDLSYGPPEFSWRHENSGGPYDKSEVPIYLTDFS